MPNTLATGLILAAGKGTRMKSDLPKTLHQVCGLPMVELVGRAMRQAGIAKPVLVIGHGGEQVQETLGESYDYAWQREQKGTGHAVQMAEAILQSSEASIVLVAPGDSPLITAEIFQGLLNAHRTSGAACTVASIQLEDPTGYGRIIQNDQGRFVKIVEEKDATPEERRTKSCAASLYCFDKKALLECLPRLQADNAQGEYYLTDVLAMLADQVEIFEVEDSEALLGVNDRWQLAQVEKILRMRVLKRHALNGVTLIDPDTIHIGLDVEIGPETILEPNTYLHGETKIGRNCRLGPCTRIRNTKIDDGCYVYMSYVNDAELGEGVKIGPYANIRPGTKIGKGSKIGNFVEIKKSELGENVAVSHLTYIGDASVGARTNVGAGTITCNYDGFAKHRTEIGEDAFIGSNSTLVAPITIGEGAMIAAGSVVTHNVPENSLAIGRGRQEVKEKWAQQWRNKKKNS